MCGKKPFGNPAVFLHRVQEILHPEPEKARNPGRNLATGDKNVLCGRKRARYLELDELHHFVERKGTSETSENAYVVAMVSRLSRQFVAVAAAFDKSSERLQAVLEVFTDAYNVFAVAKLRFRHGRDPNARELPFSVLDFLQSMRLATAAGKKGLTNLIFVLQ